MATGAGSGPSEAVSRLLSAHGGQIYGLGLRMCGNPQDAEDLVQETFLQAFRTWERFEGRSKPSTWLYTIATRLCLRRKRRKAGEPERLDSIEELLAGPDAARLVAKRDDPFEALRREEAHEAAERAISRLPSGFRLPLLLKEMLDLPIRDIAAALRLKESTVKTRIHRARLFLAVQLSKDRVETASSSKPSHGSDACLELLRAKQEAIDRGLDLAVADDELCDRCRILFRSLDLAGSACRATTRSLPGDVRRKTAKALTRT